MKHNVIILAVLLFICCTFQSSQAATIAWEASSGLTPDQIGYTLFDTSAPEDPVLSPSFLTLGNDNALELMGYIMSEADLLLPSVIEVSFRMRYVSGSNTVDFRTPAAIFVTTSADTGSVLFIGQDEIFLTSGHTTRGPENTSIDTNESFHDYLFRIEGTAAGSAVSVFQDNNLVLTGSSFIANETHGPDLRIAFGDGTSNEFGTSEWEYFSHNSGLTPEPSRALLLLIGLFPVIVRRRR